MKNFARLINNMASDTPKLLLTTPCRSNGMAEQFIQTFKKAMKKMRLEENVDNKKLS